MIKMSKEMIVKQKAVKMGFKKVNVGEGQKSSSLP